MTAAPLLRVEDLTVRFRTRRGPVRALSGVGLDVERGSFRIVIGESGSGKSVLAHALLGLLPRNTEVEGTVRFDGEDLLGIDAGRLREIRSRHLAYVPQDPGASLDPIRTIRRQLRDGARVKGVDPRELDPAVRRALTALDLDPAEIGDRRAHQLSGGMQQRVLTALALLGDPDLVIADEPTSGLDRDRVDEVAGQLTRLTTSGAAVLVITHDLGLAHRLGGRTAIVYGGRIVEERATADLFADPAHPYTRALLASLPERGLVPLPGEPPDLAGDPPPGCPFAPRCPRVRPHCLDGFPDPIPVDAGHVRCVDHVAR